MHTYVETNFVLELALQQEGFEACTHILDLAVRGKLELFIPAYSLVEPYEALGRRHSERKELRSRLDQQLHLIRRTSKHHERLGRFDDATALLLESIDLETESLQAVEERLLEHASLIVLDARVLGRVGEVGGRFGLKEQDATILASVLRHLEEARPEHACFINKNRKDFLDPYIKEALAALNCKVIGRFSDGLAYVQSQV